MGTKKYTTNNFCPTCKIGISPQASFCKLHSRIHTPEWRAYFSKKMKGRVFTPEWRKKISLAKMGNTCGRFGKGIPRPPLSQEARKKISEALKKHIRTPEHCKSISEGLKRAGVRPPGVPPESCKRGADHYMWKGGLPKCKVCNKFLSYASKTLLCKQHAPPLSKETREKISKGNKGKRIGKLNHFWKGGITPIHASLRKSFEYKIWRESVFQRDNWTCQWCKKKAYKGLGHRVPLNIDHIKPFAYYPELRFDINNGRTLCIECHAWKTKMDNKLYKNQKTIIKV